MPSVYFGSSIPSSLLHRQEEVFRPYRILQQLPPLLSNQTNPHRAMFGSGIFITKLIADGDTHKLLGMQVIGGGAVDKMTDIAVAGISMGCKVEDFITMDFAYAPPFSTAIHPFAAACGILLNKMSGRLDSFTPAEYAAGAGNGYRLGDAHPAPTLPGADWVDLTKNLGIGKS